MPKRESTLLLGWGMNLAATILGPCEGGVRGLGIAYC